jgi:hypothetical protein
MWFGKPEDRKERERYREMKKPQTSSGSIVKTIEVYPLGNNLLYTL